MPAPGRRAAWLSCGSCACRGPSSVRQRCRSARVWGGCRGPPSECVENGEKNDQTNGALGFVKLENLSLHLGLCFIAGPRRHLLRRLTSSPPTSGGRMRTAPFGLPHAFPSRARRRPLPTTSLWGRRPSREKMEADGHPSRARTVRAAVFAAARGCHCRAAQLQLPPAPPCFSLLEPKHQPLYFTDSYYPSEKRPTCGRVM